jgi:hypothetical protein
MIAEWGWPRVAKIWLDTNVVLVMGYCAGMLNRVPKDCGDKMKNLTASLLTFLYWLISAAFIVAVYVMILLAIVAFVPPQVLK